MKKINTIYFPNSQSFDILTASQMAEVKGGNTSYTDLLASAGLTEADITAAIAEATAAVGPICATLDDKRRDRPGGGISTH
jgi:hypothetical protein